MAVIDTDKYISIVKGGNMDDMFDYGVEIGSLTPQVEMGDTVEKSMLRYIWNDSIFNKITRKLEVGEKPYQELKEYHFPTNKGDKG